MMKRLRLGKDKLMEDNIIKDVEILFRLKKKQMTTIKKERDLFILKKEIDDTIVKDTKNIF